MDLAGLSLAERPALFKEISSLVPADLPAILPVKFATRRGWLVSQAEEARRLLMSAAGVKSRPSESREKLGGVGAADGARVRTIKHALLLAMATAAKDEPEMERHTLAALGERHDSPSGASLTEALSCATLTMTMGSSPGSLDGPTLRGLVMDTWSTIETPGRGSLRDGLFELIRNRLTTGTGAFLGLLRGHGWTDDLIAEELRAMVLAGWGSTTAAVLSSISLAVASRLSEELVMDEVLRLYPPSFMVARTITEWEPILPYEIGDTVVVSPWLIHRHPAGWANPEKFDPDRWSVTAPGRQWFLPFGMGVRRCPASTFARTQARVAGSAFANLPAPISLELGLIESRSPALVPSW